MNGVRFFLTAAVLSSLVTSAMGADFMLGDSATDIVREGGVALSAGHRDVARADYDRAISTDPNCIPAYLARVQLRLQDGDIPGGVADIDKVITLDPRSASSFAITSTVAISGGK